MAIKYDLDRDVPSLIAVHKAACTNEVIEFENIEFSTLRLSLIQGYENAPALDAKKLLQKSQERQI